MPSESDADAVTLIVAGAVNVVIDEGDLSETEGAALEVPVVTAAPVNVAAASVETLGLLTARPT